MTRGIPRRWHKWTAGLALAAGTGGFAGCTKPLYMTPETQHIVSTVAIPADLPTNPAVANPENVSDHNPPATVLDANREPRPMTLQEAMAIALERGTRGQGSSFLFQNFNLGTSGLQSGFNGSYNDDLVQFTGRGITGDDSIRAFALDPAIVEADVEGALSKFDARFTTSMTWRKQDQQVANIFNNFNNGDFAAFSAGLVKPLPTGGIADITFETNYTKLGAVPQGFAVINPSYTPSLTFRIEQPIWRDWGVDINQLLPQHPGSTQIPGFRPTGGRAEGILVTRIRADQAKAEFEREVNFLVFNVELAYWSLYGRYYTKYASEQALKQAYVTWEQLQQLQVAGLQTKQGVAQARAQFEDFRLQYLVALQNVLEAERRLRGILGLPLEDGTRIVPADTPVLAPYRPDYKTSLVEALNTRPELRMARQELKVQQLNVIVQENNYRPDVRVGASYNINSIGTRLDGPGPIRNVDALGNLIDTPGNALGSLADDRFNNWSLFIRADVPIGYRDAHAALKVAQLNLARSHVVLKNQERKAEFFLGSLYQQLVAYHEQIKLQQQRRIALGTQLQGQFERVKIGKDPLIQLLDAQRSFTGSIQAEADAIVSYNVAIAGFHLAKGTIMEYNNISIADGPLPAAVAERAADHFGARSAALKLRERPSNAIAPAGAPALPMPAGVPLHGIADCPPPAEARDGLRPGGEPPLAPDTPMVIPPTPPKEALPVPPKPAGVPGSLPGMSSQDFRPAGPALPAGGIEPDGMPATPVSKYRPK